MLVIPDIENKIIQIILIVQMYDLQIYTELAIRLLVCNNFAVATDLLTQVPELAQNPPR